MNPYAVPGVKVANPLCNNILFMIIFFLFCPVSFFPPPFFRCSRKVVTFVCRCAHRHQPSTKASHGQACSPANHRGAKGVSGQRCGMFFCFLVFCGFFGLSFFCTRLSLPHAACVCRVFCKSQHLSERMLVLFFLFFSKKKKKQKKKKKKQKKKKKKLGFFFHVFGIGRIQHLVSSSSRLRRQDCQG